MNVTIPPDRRGRDAIDDILLDLSDDSVDAPVDAPAPAPAPVTAPVTVTVTAVATDTDSIAVSRSWPRPSLAALAQFVPFVLAVVLWLVSLGSVDLARMSDWGLLPALPLTWYLAVASLVGGAAWAVVRRRVGPIALYALALVVVLYGTVAAVSDPPHYFWAYKHIGVTRYIELHGSVDKSIDIYQRWPGFFAVTAVFSWLAGRENPVDYAAWAEIFFTGATAVLVAAVATRLLRDKALGWTAALLFVLTNWVGQSYFAPQAFAFLLMIGVYLLLLDHFVEPRPNWVSRRVFAAVGWLVRHPVTVADEPVASGEPAATDRPAATAKASSRWPRWAVAVLVVVGQVAVVASHQLTPYMFLAGMGTLTVLGAVRPWWLVATLALVTVAYLIPNFSYVQGSFGLFTGVDPLANTRTSGVLPVDPMPGKVFNATAGRALTFTIWTLGAIGAARWLRRPGEGGRALVAIVLAVCSGGLLLGQSYGGEGILRVVLFSLPWAAVLAARALPVERTWRRTVVVTGVLTLLTALFLPSFFGQEKLNIQPADQVAAAEYLYTEGEPGLPIATATPDFPVRLGAQYDRYGPNSQNVPNLIEYPEFQHRELGEADVDDVVRFMTMMGERGYLVFSTTQESYAEIYQLTPPGALRDLEAALVDSESFTIWHETPNTRIYEFQAPVR